MRWYYALLITGVFGVLILTMVACSNKDIQIYNYIYKGESEHWAAEYTFNGNGTFRSENDKLKYEASSDQRFTLTYKGELSELASVKRLVYSYESSMGSGKNEMNFTSPPDSNVFVSLSSSRGRAMENKDEAIKVSVDFDGRTEVLELRSK